MLSTRLRKQGRDIGGALFAAPAMLVYLVFVGYPIAHTLGLSLFKWNGISPEMIFVGLANYKELFLEDEVFRLALWNNLQWILITLLIPMLVGLTLAALLSNAHRGDQLWSALFFVPVVVPPVAAGIAWDLIYHPRVGLLNSILRALGLEKFSMAWLGNAEVALYACIQVGNWIFYGFCMLVFMNALKLIDRNLYEAAEIDGANGAQVFFRITIPLLRNSITFVTVYSVIAAFKAFEIVFVLTGGGPYHRTELVSTYMYSMMFNGLRIGYSAAIAAVLALMAIVSAVLIIVIREHRE